MSPKVHNPDPVLGLLQSIVDRPDTGSFNLDALGRWLEGRWDLPLRALWLRRRENWVGPGSGSSSAGPTPPERADLPDQGLHVGEECVWVPIRDRGGLLGVLGLESRPESDALAEIRTVFPFLLAHFHRDYPFSAASQHELLDVQQNVTPSLDELRTSQGLDEILQALVNTVSEVFECDNCRFFWRDSPDRLELRAESETTEDLGIELSVDGDPMVQRVIYEGKSALVNDLPESRDNWDFDRDVRSFMTVPFRHEDQVLGSVNLTSHNPDVYTRDDLERFSVLCDNFASVYAVTQEFINLTDYIEKILTNLPVGIVNFQVGRDELLLNPTACDILELEERRVPRSEFHDHVRDGLNAPEFLQMLELNPDQEELGPTDYEFVEDESREPTIVKAHRTTVRNTEDVLSGVLIVLSDVTEQRQLSRQVNRAERLAALGELASSLAHEIKNPLTSIHGFVQMMPGRKDDQAFIEKTAGILDRECSRLNSLLENLLSFAQPQVGHRSSQNLREMIEDLQVLINKQLEKQNIQLETKVPDSLEVYGDPSKLKQVLMNLMLNAVDAMDEGGCLNIQAESGGDGYRYITVSDDGVGMKPGEQDRVFNPFYTTKEEGTGLGMAITHRIVEEHGGRITIDSTPDEGTDITVVLPDEETSQKLEDEVVEPS